MFLFAVGAIAVRPTYHTNERVPTLTFDVREVDGRTLGVGDRLGLGVRSESSVFPYSI